MATPTPVSITKHILATHPDFKARIRVLLIGDAIDIIGEDPTGKTAEYISKRHTLGVQIVNNPDSYVDRFAFAVVSYNASAITDTSSDSDIQWTISAVFNDIAGLTYTDTIPVSAP